ncbi:MAG: PaaI family thioesterase [Chloracidobacterium sp.]|uniref:PaaI family thioesterase n=1 Tax=Chloracidobacterium validum TaxID=2821543 RepID=A0ABX8BFI9_9BACT|nr:PaaI family thioesterase [Chloracidobacterium validum]QUW04280.1 PaaI family thioesterase [Chloracidobacterium validum]
MSNNRLKAFQRLIGQPLAEHSPSPLARWLGGTLEHAAPGETTFAFVVRTDMANPAGILHGGAAAAIMDEVIGATVHGTLEVNVFYTSVNLVIDFLDSVPVGAAITATTRVIRQGKTIINAECWLRDAQERLLAHATTNMLRTNVPLQMGE